ncbi:MAG: hypothetical protein ACLUVG_20695 [Phocaeicola vulgatus]
MAILVRTMVYRGVYDGSKVYYGTSRRRCSKIQRTLLCCQVDAGNGFQNHVPTDTVY